MAREKLKTVLLTCLFLTSIALTALNLNVINYDIKDSVFAKNEEYGGLGMVFKPDRIFIHFGGGGGNNIEVIDGKDAYWKELQLLFKQALNSTDKISEKDFNESQKLKQLKSVEIKLPFEMSGSFFSSALGVQKSKLDKYEGIGSIIIPLVDDRGIYFLLSNGNAVRVERSSMQKTSAIQRLEKEFESGGLVRYYAMNSIFPVDSNVLIPVDTSNYKYLYFRSKSGVKTSDDDEIVQIARNVFDEKYDFINRVVETGGANTFIYGFGERVLRIQPDGEIEYLDETVKGSGIRQEDAVLKAIDFVSKMDVDSQNLIIDSIEQLQIYGKRSYKIVFSYNIDGLKLKSHDNTVENIDVTIVGDSVYSYRSKIKNIEDNMTVNLFSENEILSPQIILSDNFDYFKTKFELMKNENEEVSTRILDKIRSIELIYFINEREVFTPAWYFDIDGQSCIFDAYTGEILNYGLGKS